MKQWTQTKMLHVDLIFLSIMLLTPHYISTCIDINDNYYYFNDSTGIFFLGLRTSQTHG